MALRAVLVATLTAAAMTMTACGTSEEDKADNKVCDARADINKQIDKLRQLTPSTVTLDAVTAPVQAISDDLKTITDAQGDLNDDRRKEIQAANKAFAAQVRDIASTVLRSTSVAEAKSQLTTAVDNLANAYRSTFAKVSCD